MGNQWEAHSAVINLGKPITRKTVDVSQRRFEQWQLETVK